MSKIFSDLNQAQIEAVKNINGPMMIVAGPGSGKTKTLTHKIAFLLESGVAPEKILGLTFTNKAAEEMRRRVAILVKPELAAKIFLGTFHRLGVLILRQESWRLGFGRSFSIYDEDESLEAMKQALKNLGQGKDEPQAILKKFSFWRNRQEISFVKPSLPENIFLPAQEYLKILKERQAFDFDDLLEKPLEIFHSFPEALQKFQKTWDYILVDEYQDTNAPQYDLVNLLAHHHRNLCVIGDDWQSIYRFRAADFKNVLRFEKDWPDAKVFFLEENYRSTKNIVSASQELIKKNVFRTEKNLFTNNPLGKPVSLIQFLDGREEAIWVRDRILAELRSGRKSSEFAILFRTNVQSRIFEELFLESGLVYQLVGGFRFYKRREILDLQSYLQVIFNPKDFLAFSRAAQSPRRGIGVKALADWVVIQKKISPKLKVFCDFLEKARQEINQRKASDFLSWLLEKINYREFLLQEGEIGEERWENVQELVGICRSFDLEAPPFGLEKFLESLKLVQSADEPQDFRPKISLMTIHSAKGLEFPFVFVVGLEDGILPHDRSMRSEEDLEEERRLLYVAMTRAKEELFLSFAKTRFLRGDFSDRPPSRFLSDLPMSEINFVDQAFGSHDGRETDFGDEIIYLD